jgi:nucleotide-binding universal stress UspA family protein
MKILLATDGSINSNAAVEEVANRPFPEGTQVLIMSAYENTPFIVSESAVMGGLAGGYEEAGNIAMNLAEKTVQVASETVKEKNPGLSISTKVVIDFPKEGILKEAELFDADLIVMGSHGQSALSRFLLGSVSHAVALHANCSVEIVRIPDRNNTQNKKEMK